MKWAGILASTVVLLSASVAKAEKIKVPGHHATIQEAVDRAVDGDQIIVSRGAYSEVVEIDGKSDLRIRGKGKPIVVQFLVSGSANVRLEGFVVDGSLFQGVGVFDCQDVTLRKLTVRYADGDGITLATSTRTIVERVLLHDIGRHGIVVNGEENRIDKSQAVDCGENGFLIQSGERNHLLRNKAVRSRNDGFAVWSANNLFERNTVLAAGDDGYEIWKGDRNVFNRNQAISVGEVGFQVESDGNRFFRNKVNGAKEDGFALYSGTNGEYEKNRVLRSARYGFLVEASGNLFTRNKGAKSGVLDLMDQAGGNTYHQNSFHTRGP